MNWTTSIYLLTRLDGLKDLFDMFIFVVMLLYGVYYILKAFYYGVIVELEVNEFISKFKNFKRNGVIVIIVCVILTLLKTLTPTTKEAIVIVASGKTLDYVSNDTSLAKIPRITNDIVVSWLDNKLKEIKDTTLNEIKKIEKK